MACGNDEGGQLGLISQNLKALKKDDGSNNDVTLAKLKYQSALNKLIKLDTNLNITCKLLPKF